MSKNLPKNDVNKEYNNSSNLEHNKSKEHQIHSPNENLTTDVDASVVITEVKLKLAIVFIVSLVLTVVIISLTVLIVWIVHFNRAQIYLYTPFIFFVECGFLFIFGGCIGTVKQSFTIDWVKVKLMKGEHITGADTKIAICSAYTYILVGLFLSIISLIAWLFVRN